MGATVASLGSFFNEHIVDAHKLPAFIYLVFFLGTFAFIRTSAHMIRAQVSWWPGNVEVGGTHIHHLVWRSLGGDDQAANQVLLHPACHQQVHRRDLAVGKPRPVARASRKA